MLRRLEAAMLLDYDADEIGSVLLHKLNLKLKGDLNMLAMSQS